MAKIDQKWGKRTLVLIIITANWNLKTSKYVTLFGADQNTRS